MPNVIHAARVAALCTMLAACGGPGGESGDGAATAARPTPGISGDTITLGALTPLSDAVALIGKPVLAGVETYFRQLNEEKGGVAGRYKVRILAEDVTYGNPSTSVQKYSKIRDQVAMFAFILGTDHVNVTLPLLAEDNLLAVPSTMDAEWVREPQLISALAPYQMQVINGIHHFREQGGRGKTTCGMVMATGYGQAAEEGLTFAGEQMGFTAGTVARFRPGDQEFVAQVTQLRNARCEAVVLASLPSETGRILGTAAQLDFRPRWIATSPSWHKVLGKSAIGAYATEHVWISGEGSEWGDTTVAGMRAILRAMQAFAPGQEPDVYFVAGYNYARSAHAVLEEAAAAGDLSRAGIARALVSLDSVSYDGLAFTYRYGPVETREPPRMNSIFAVDPTNPIGQHLVAYGVNSDAARAWKFERRKP